MRKPHDVIYLTQDSSNLEQEIYWCQDKIDEADIKYIRADLVPQTKPLSDEEMKELINNFPIIFSPQDLLKFARAIEERHGIK